MTSPEENQARGEAPTVAKLQQTVEAALDRFVYDTSKREWLTDARAALRDLVVQAERVAELEAALRDAGEALRAAHDPERWSDFLSAQVDDLLARIDALAGDGGFPKDRIMPTSGACAPNHYGDRPCGWFGDRCDCGDGGGA